MTQPNKSTAVQVVKSAPSLVGFKKEDLVEAFKAALPNAGDLTTAQIAGAAVAAQSLDLNPINKEFYITTKGTMQASASIIGAVNEWLRESGEGDLEFTYVGIGQLSVDEIRRQLSAFGVTPDSGATISTLYPQLCKLLDVDPAVDVVELVRAWKPKAQQRHIDQIKELRALGFTTDQIMQSFGSLKSQPAHEAWGIVRRREAKDVKDKNGNVTKAAALAWAEMCEKYSPLERARKRGRTACARAIAPVTVAMQRRMRDGKRVVTEQRVVTTNTAPAEGLTIKPTDIIDAQAQEHAPIDAEVVQPEPPVMADTDDDEDTEIIDADAGPLFAQEEETPEPPTAPARDIDAGMPADAIALRRAVTAKAQAYAEAGRDADEKRRNWVRVMIYMDICKGKSKADTDTRAHRVIEYLTGFERYADVPGAYVEALKDIWLQPAKKPGDTYPSPCDQARKMAEIIIGRFRTTAEAATA